MSQKKLFTAEFRAFLGDSTLSQAQPPRTYEDTNNLSENLTIDEYGKFFKIIVKPHLKDTFTADQIENLL